MSLVHASLRPSEPAVRRQAGLTVRAMEIGRHVIAVALTVIGVARAVDDGTPVALAAAVAIAFLAWHSAGTLLTRRLREPEADQRWAVWWLLGLTLLWGIAVAVSAEFVWLAFLLWLLAGHLLPLWWGLGLAVVVLVAVAVAPLLHHGHTTWANVAGPMIGGIFAFGISRGYLQLLRDGAERERLLASLSRAQQEAAQLQDELALAQRRSGAIAERSRISRDLHDTVAQGLSSIRLLAHAEAQRTEDPSAARTLGQVEQLSRDSLADVRRIVAALVPSQLEDDALAGALRTVLDRLHEQTGIDVDLHVDGDLPALPSTVEVALLRTAQSALGNVRQHSGATRVRATLVGSADSVRLDIRDDGTGFDAAGWEHAGSGAPAAEEGDGSGFGLRFMRARLRELGGGLDVESRPGEGTAISAHLRLRPEHRAAEDTAPGGTHP